MNLKVRFSGEQNIASSSDDNFLQQDHYPKNFLNNMIAKNRKKARAEKVGVGTDYNTPSKVKTNNARAPWTPRRETEKELVLRALLSNYKNKNIVLNLYNALETGLPLQPLETDLLFKVKFAFSDQIMNELSQSGQIMFNETQIRILKNLKSKLHDNINHYLSGIELILFQQVNRHFSLDPIIKKQLWQQDSNNVINISRSDARMMPTDILSPDKTLSFSSSNHPPPHCCNISGGNSGFSRRRRRKKRRRSTNNRKTKKKNGRKQKC